MLQVAMISVHTCPLARLGSRETGGMNVYIRELSRHLGQRGIAVDVFTRRQDRETPEIVEFGENARVIHLEAGPASPMDKYQVLGHLPEFAAGMNGFLQRTVREYHLIHSHYWLSAPVAVSLSREWKLPLVTMFHTLGSAKNRASTGGNERERDVRIEIERGAMLSSELVVAASPSDMEQMVKYYGMAPSRIRVVSGGVDAAVFRRLPRQVARDLLNVGSEKVVLFVGRIQQLKGTDLLLQAFARLLQGWPAQPRPRLMVVGGRNAAGVDDPEALEIGRLKRLARELGIADEITFQGAVPHHSLPIYYSAADVVVMPSLYESFGLVALEAMACGTPVVASRVGGLQWTVQDGRTGFLVCRSSAEQFAAAVARILLDDQLRSFMSEQAEKAARAYSWPEVAARTIQLYGELIPISQEQLALVDR